MGASPLGVGARPDHWVDPSAVTSALLPCPELARTRPLIGGRLVFGFTFPRCLGVWTVDVVALGGPGYCTQKGICVGSRSLFSPPGGFPFPPGCFFAFPPAAVGGWRFPGGLGFSRGGVLEGGWDAGLSALPFRPLL